MAGFQRPLTERIINTFISFGVKSKPLIRTTLKEQGRDWMEKLINLIVQKDEYGRLDSVDGFAVWALQHPAKVTFDASGSEASKKKRKKKPGTRLSRHNEDPTLWRHSRSLCEQCGKGAPVDGCWCQPCIDEAVAAAEVHHGLNGNGQTASSGSRRF